MQGIAKKSEYNFKINLQKNKLSYRSVVCTIRLIQESDFLWQKKSSFSFSSIEDAISVHVIKRLKKYWDYTADIYLYLSLLFSNNIFSGGNRNRPYNLSILCLLILWNLISPPIWEFLIFFSYYQNIINVLTFLIMKSALLHHYLFFCYDF